jgi:hypothetical protein
VPADGRQAKKGTQARASTHTPARRRRRPRSRKHLARRAAAAVLALSLASGIVQLVQEVAARPAIVIIRQVPAAQPCDKLERVCAPLGLQRRPTYHPLTNGSTSMATRRGSRMTRKARRRLNGIFLTVIGLSVVVSIIAAATGSHNTGNGTPTPQSSSVAASATVAASPGASAAAKTRRHRRHHRHHRPRPKPISATTTAPAAPAAPTGCYPISDEGTCYEPGEYCRDSDHGASGVAGDGEAIVCEDNDGWRWEPA